ncbi:MAG: fibronectin type III domain-containing protein [Lachnospiraceae bacterium]|nr:fibronectin type III domain-containing protein [Lachnospiraceae bacterium]
MKKLKKIVPLSMAIVLALTNIPITSYAEPLSAKSEEGGAFRQSEPAEEGIAFPQDESVEESAALLQSEPTEEGAAFRQNEPAAETLGCAADDPEGETPSGNENDGSGNGSSGQQDGNSDSSGQQDDHSGDSGQQNDSSGGSGQQDDHSGDSGQQNDHSGSSGQQDGNNGGSGENEQHAGLDFSKIDPSKLEVAYTSALTNPETNAQDCFIWTGSAIRPPFSLTYDGTALDSNSYLITEYSNNTEVSTTDAKATITIEGIEDNTGMTTLSFTILPVTLTRLTGEPDEPESKHIDAVTCKVDNPTYTGKDTVRPSVTITYQQAEAKTLTLVEDEDYTITYTNTTATGGTYTITYQNHYKGFFTGTYETKPVILDEQTNATLSYHSLPYKGAAYTIEDFGISITANGIPLTKDVDYEITAGDELKDAGNHIITVTAIAEDEDDDTLNLKFTGVYAIDVVIDPVNISDEQAAAFSYRDPETAIYNGRQQTLPLQAAVSGGYENLSLTYKAGTETVSAVYGTDFKVLSYKNNINAGTATAVIGAASDNFIGTREVSFEIAQFDLSSADSQTGASAAEVAAIDPQEYIGKALEPTVSVTASLVSGAKAATLKAGTDYTVEYADNINVGAGTAKVKVTGKGNYTGTLEAVFTITGNATAFEEAEVKVDTLTFNGAVQTPVITATTTLGGTAVTLVQGTDYTITAVKDQNGNSQSLKETGTYILELTGKGNYAGTVTATATIEKASLQAANVKISFSDYDSIDGETAYYIYNEKPLKPGVIVSIDGNTVTNTGAGSEEPIEYKVSYKNNRLVGTATVIVKALGNNMTGETTATFRIGYDIDKLASIEFVDTSDDNGILSYPFTGGEIKPAIRAYSNGTLLTEGKDYLVEYKNNKDVTTGATAGIIGIGTYAGHTQSSEGVKTFQITPLDKIDAKSVTFHDADGDLIDANYVGSFEGKPFKIGEVQLNKIPLDSKNYVLSYSGNDKVGHTVVTLNWQGSNFTSDVTTNDEIVIEFDLRILITEAVFSAIAKQTYTGSAITPDFTVTLKYGTEILTLTKDQDYTISYEDNIDAGDATIKITGTKDQGTYAGTAETEFEILPRTLTDAIIAPIPDQTYVNADVEITPALTVTCGGRTLTEGVDYEADYEGNDGAGTAAVTISPAGENYDGEASATFRILPRVIDNAVIKVSDCYYTGSEIEPEAVVILDGLDITDGIEFEYEDNEDVGTATITAIGTENYTGSVSSKFKIKPQLLKNLKVKAISAQAYTGKALRPKVKLYNDDNTLETGTDYTVTYKNNKKPGTATITIKAKGKNYTGTRKVKFKIAVTKPTAVKATVKSGGALKITAKRNASSGLISGYQICYRIKGKRKWIRKTVEADKNLSDTLTELKAGQVYQVRVRAYALVGSKKKYSSYSSIVTTKAIKK